MKISNDDYKKAPLQNKHVPQRSCAACRKCDAKKELIRLVLDSGIVEVDHTGKKPGRGIYLCKNSECWENALKKNRLQYGLRVQLSPANRQSLLEYGMNLKKGQK